MIIVKQVKERRKKKLWADKYTCIEKPRNPKKEGDWEELTSGGGRGVARVTFSSAFTSTGTGPAPPARPFFRDF